MKSRDGKSQGREEKRRRKKIKEDQSRESQKKEDPGARKKVGKSRNIVFPMIWGSGWSRVGSLKRRVRSQLARWEMKNCTPLWREARAQVKNARNTPSLEHFLKLRCGKSARVVAQSTFPSQHVQNTPGSKHFWQLRCRKSARRCGATRISKSKRTKPFMFGALLEVQISISKKCTPLWRKARFQVKMLKALHVRSNFGGWDVERVHAAVARRAFPS